MKAFKYSGSKIDLLPLLKRPPQGTARVIELFAGSMAYGLNSGLPFKGLDTSDYVIEAWKYIKQGPRQFFIDTVKKLEGTKTDIRSVPGLLAGEIALLKLELTGLYVGQLSSWTTYPQHRFNTDNLIAVSNYCSKFLIEVFKKNAKYGTDATDSDLLFVDPPYLGTSANYSTEYFDPGILQEYLLSLKCPIIVTYGNGAKDVFPELDWHVLCERKAANARGTGSISRVEHVCYLNFKDTE